jgi:hypothetical protein
MDDSGSKNIENHSSLKQEEKKEKNSLEEN